MTKQDAIRLFEEEKQYVENKYGKKDRAAIRTAWNDFTDMLCKDGQITQKQYDTWIPPYKY